jgi:hypothetical protein
MKSGTYWGSHPAGTPVLALEKGAQHRHLQVLAAAGTAPVLAGTGHSRGQIRPLAQRLSLVQPVVKRVCTGLPYGCRGPP